MTNWPVLIVVTPRATSSTMPQYSCPIKAGSRATKPKDGGRYLLRATKSSDRLISHDLLHGVGLLGQHRRDHRCVDGSRAHRVDADASGGILERRALGESEHSVLSCVVYGSTGQADQPTDRRAVHNCAATLLAHLLQLVFHAVPDAAEVDRDHAIEFRAAGIRRFDRGTLYAGVIEGGNQPSKDLHRLIDHRRHLGLVGDVAAHGDRPVPGCDQIINCSASGPFIDVRERYSSARLRKGARSYQAHAGGRTGNDGYLTFKRPVHQGTHNSYLTQ